MILCKERPVINRYRKPACLVVGSSAHFEEWHILRTGYLPHVFGVDLCSACFMPSLGRGLAFSAGGPNPDLPHIAGGQAERTAPRLCSGDAAVEP